MVKKSPDLSSKKQKYMVFLSKKGKAMVKVCGNLRLRHTFFVLYRKKFQNWEKT